MAERIEELDRSMDLILVFLSIISAAIFQYVTALPYEESEEAVFHFFVRFTLRLLFLPILLIIPVWLTLRIIRNDDIRAIIRIFVWNLAPVAMALNATILIVFCFPSVFRSEYTVNIYGLITVVVTFGFALVIQITVIRTYIRAFLSQLSVRDFFLRERFRIMRVVVRIIPTVLFLLIIWSSLQV